MSIFHNFSLVESHSFTNVLCPPRSQGTTNTPQGKIISPTSIQDLLSLPLSTYFSLPLSNLVQALNQAFSPQPSVHTVAHLVSTPASSCMSSRNSAQPAAPVTSRLQRPRPSHTSTSTALAWSWSNSLEPIDVGAFVEEVGPTVEIPQIPADVFQLYFKEDLCTYVEEQTNLYAQQVMGSDKETVQELRAYFGFQIYTGIVNEQATEDY